MKEKFEYDMTASEVIEIVGKRIWNKMAKIMKGQTGEIRDGKLYMYNYDLNQAYRKAFNGECANK